MHARSMGDSPPHKPDELRHCRVICSSCLAPVGCTYTLHNSLSTSVPLQRRVPRLPHQRAPDTRHSTIFMYLCSSSSTVGVRCNAQMPNAHQTNHGVHEVQPSATTVAKRNVLYCR